jgi:calcineurin-like phosphoesterase family protein
MLRPWKFSTKEHKLFFTSDCHFNHNKEFLFKPRGYNSVEEHDAEIIRIWNERVGKDDTVIHLGDFIFQATDSLAEQYLQKLNGHIITLWGNHNSGVKQLYHRLVWEFLHKGEVYPGYLLTKDQVDVEIYPLTYMLDGLPKLTFASNYMHGKIDHVEFVSTHYAMAIWDRMQHGSLNLVGHSHSNHKESNPGHTECKRLDVGIENFGGPVEFYDMMKIMNTKKITQYDHHNHKTTSSSF